MFFKSDFKTRETEDEMIIEGYFIVYDNPTELWRGFHEKIAQKACRNSILNGDIRALFNHNSGTVLGRMKSQTLELSEDSYGVKGAIRINPQDSEARNIYERVKRGDISGCSFGFYPRDEEYIENSDGSVTAVVKEADVIEVSVCTFPAYPQTSIEARAADLESYRQKREEAKKEIETKNVKEEVQKLKERYNNVTSNS